MTCAARSEEPTPIREGVVVERGVSQLVEDIELPEVPDPVGQVAAVISSMVAALSLSTADDPGAVERKIRQTLNEEGYSPAVQVQAVHSFKTLIDALLMGTLTKKSRPSSRLRFVPPYHKL